MKDYKLYQEYYHRTTDITKLDDFNATLCPIPPGAENLINSIVSYLSSEWKADWLPCPTKSYAVALIYATLISKWFNEDFYEVLSDPMLLYGNDKNFKPYSNETAEIYDAVINQVSTIVNYRVPQTVSTVGYFLQEFRKPDGPLPIS